MVRQMEKQDEAKKPSVDKKEPKAPRKLETADGRPLNVNQPKISFSLHDENERNQFLLDLTIPKLVNLETLCTTNDIH